MRFKQYFKLISEMKLVNNVSDKSSDKMYFVATNDTVNLRSEYYKQGEASHNGYINTSLKKIFFNTMAESRSWALNQFAHNKKLKDVLKTINSQIPLKGFEVYVGRYYNNEFSEQNHVGSYESVMGEQDILQSETLTLYHGTNSVYWEEIKKFGLRSTFSTGKKEWETSGRYYKDKQPIYLATTKERALEYANNAHENNPQGQPIILKVTILADNTKLFADDDYLDLQTKKDIHDWRDSLKQTGQLVYIGRIPSQFLELVYPKTLPKLYNNKFQRVEDHTHIDYRETMETAFNEYVSYKKIKSALEAIRDDTYFKDEAWDIIKETDIEDDEWEDDGEWRDAALTIAGAMDWDVMNSLDDHFVQSASSYYKTKEEYLDDYKEHSGDFEQVFDFEGNEEEQDALASFGTHHDHMVNKFKKWRADLFRKS